MKNSTRVEATSQPSMIHPRRYNGAFIVNVHDVAGIRRKLV
jgi:hypothetical protein